MAAHCPIFTAMQAAVLTQGVTNAADFSLMASSDPSVLKEIVDVAEAAGVKLSQNQTF